MFPLGTRPGPPPRLPLPVPPFPGETTDSYLRRLAIANELHPDDLRVHLAGRRGHAPVTLAALAAATGRTQRALAWALPELRPGVTPQADPVLPGHVRRTVCWRCSARRGVFSYATAWQPAESCICPDHRIWLGSAAHPRQPGQYDVAGLADILQAQQRHYRLARRHGRREAVDAIAEAAHITALWARHGFYLDRRIPLIRALRDEVPLTGKLPSGDAVTAVVTYPETVDLARVLAMPRWLIPAAAAACDLQRFQHEVRCCTGIGYEHEDSRYDPLFRWFQKHCQPRASLTGLRAPGRLRDLPGRTPGIIPSRDSMPISTLNNVEKSSSANLMDTLDAGQRAALEAMGKPVRYPAEHTIFWEGQPSYSVLVIQEGHVKVTRRATDGAEVILAIRGPGDIMGDEGVLLDQARSATVTTITEVTGVDVKADALLGFVEDRHLWPAMLRAAVRRRNQAEEEVILTRLSVGSRLAGWLLQLAAEVGERTDEGWVIAVSLSQEDLAARIGASRDAVAIELRRLREQGVIATGRRRIVIRDPDALGRMVPYKTD